MAVRKVLVDYASDTWARVEGSAQHPVKVLLENAGLLDDPVGETVFLFQGFVDAVELLERGAEEHLARQEQDDELGRLAAAFNDMADKLKQSHDQLESTVAERTAELTQRNEELQTEIAERWRAEEADRRTGPDRQCRHLNAARSSCRSWRWAPAAGSAGPTPRHRSRSALCRVRSSSVKRW